MTIPQDAVIVSVKAVDSNEPYDIIESNSHFVLALLHEGVLLEDITACAVRSHFVDLYRGQVENGGFSQFVYNTGWDDEIVTLIREGLAAMGAMQNLNLFNKAAALVDALPTGQLQTFLEQGFFDDASSNVARDHLNACDEQMFETFESEDLIGLNSKWLRQHPDLVALTREGAVAEIKRRAAM